MTTAIKIRQELLLRAPRAAVWNALSTPEGWTGWFSEGVEGEFEVGSDLSLNFGKYGICTAVVVECEEMSSFAYKWHPGEDCEKDKYPQGEMTTVRFTLEDHPEGTMLVLEESGFDRIPEGRRLNALDANTSGWRFELFELQTFVENGTRQNLGGEEIFRERSFPISRVRLWELVATPEGLSSWWTERVEGDFSVGSFAIIHFGKGVCGPLQVIEREAPEKFTFRWHPGEAEGCTWDKYPESEATTVKFVLTEIEGGSHLLIVESGFENIPEARRTSALESNRGGWTQVMQMISDAAGGS